MARKRRLCQNVRRGPCAFQLKTEKRSVHYRGWEIRALKLGRAPWFLQIMRGRHGSFFEPFETEPVMRQYEDGDLTESHLTLGDGMKRAKAVIRYKQYSEKRFREQYLEWKDSQAAKIHAAQESWDFGKEEKCSRL